MAQTNRIGQIIFRSGFAGKADYLVSGDKRDILRLAKHGQTRIVTLARMLRIPEF